MIVRLLNAASRGDIKQMKLYKAHGYTMDLKNYDSQTALHIAVRENQEEIVEFLLQECNQIILGQTQKDRWDMTPWDVAKNSGLQNVYYKFLDNCQELAQIEDDTIKTCQLFKAAATGELETLKSLQKQNFDMSQRDHSGRTALHLAVSAKNTEIVKFLVHEANVDILIRDRYNQLPMDGKTSSSIEDLMKQTKNDREDKNELKISTREDTLMRVIKASSIGILHKQKDIPRFKYFPMDSCDYLGNTPLHIAAANGKLEDVKYLLNNRKASPFVRNNSRKSPIELVEQRLKFWVDSDMHNIGIKEQFKEIKEEIEKQ
ncbi:unnamed protein product [Mytilus edulis]|uniref:Uncharacterized protein n=1 Tax=Mytilus edulis TaxID=6550 RepID=A0A8S3QF53_MYTED|nr:unnamed protein product [Mytilus edulis]